MSDYATVSDLINKLSQLDADHGSDLSVVLVIDDIDRSEEWEIGTIEINTDTGEPVVLITNGEQIT